MFVETKTAGDPAYEELQETYRLSYQSRRPDVFLQGRPGVNYIEVGGVDVSAPDGYEVPIFMGELWGHIEHDRIKVIERFNRGQL